MKSSTVDASISKEGRKGPRRIAERNRMRRIYHFDIWGDTEEWEEANANSVEKKEELSRKIELSSGYGEL